MIKINYSPESIEDLQRVVEFVENKKALKDEYDQEQLLRWAVRQSFTQN